MGSVSFADTISTPGGMETAYRIAVDEALTEHGHDPYSGTIATTVGVNRSPLCKTGERIPLSEVDWEAVTERQRHMRKWEPCEALPVYMVAPARLDHLPGRIMVETSIASDAIRDSGGDSFQKCLHEELMNAAAREVNKLLRAGGHLVTTDYRGETQKVAIQGTPKDYRVGFTSYKIVQSPKVSTRATKGATETRYFILQKPRPGFFNQKQSLPDWSAGYSTQAKARAALPRTLERSATADFEIVSMTRRSGGEALVEHSLDALAGKTAKVEITAQVSRVVEPERVLDEQGWLLYGWAAC